MSSIVRAGNPDAQTAANDGVLPSSASAAELESPPLLTRPQPASDFPAPHVLREHLVLYIDLMDQPADIGLELGHALCTADDLYRLPAYAGGLLLASPSSEVPPTEIRTPRHLASIIGDRVRVQTFLGVSRRKA